MFIYDSFNEFKFGFGYGGSSTEFEFVWEVVLVGLGLYEIMAARVSNDESQKLYYRILNLYNS